MSIFLIARALGDVSFGMRRFEFHYSVQESVDLVNFLVVGVGFDIEVYRQ
jgi:hypothetical protein